MNNTDIIMQARIRYANYPSLLIAIDQCEQAQLNGNPPYPVSLSWGTRKQNSSLEERIKECFDVEGRQNKIDQTSNIDDRLEHYLESILYGDIHIGS